MIGIKDQYFGTEIEMTGITRQRAAEVVAEMFGTEAYYDGTTYGVWSVIDLEGKKWKFMSDGSIYTQRKVYGRIVDAGGEYSTEMVSPKLSYDEMGKLQEVVRCLRQHGGFVNESCGQHVHVDASNHTPQSLKNALTIMYAKEDILFKALKVQERRANSYCQRVRPEVLEKIRKIPNKSITMDRVRNAIYKQAAGKTAKSILISVGVRLAAFNLKQIANLTCTDELDLYSIGEKKVALFCCIPDADTSMNYLVGMIYSNLFQTLYYVADRKYGGRLPIPVHCIMDEWPNVALPDDFDKILATMRSRGISCSIIIQNIAQMKALFKDSYESLIGNCDEFLYLGGNEKEGHKYVSELLGKETLDTNTYGQTKGRSGSYSVNYQQTGRELLTPDEIRLLDNRKAILFIRGERPIMDDKYDLKKHVNFRYTEDGGASPYDYAKTPLAHDDLKIDINRLDDYELLSTEDILGE